MAALRELVPRGLSLRLARPAFRVRLSPLRYCSASTSSRDAADEMSAAQTTNTVFMVAPKFFNMNPDTAVDNVYQNLPENLKGAGGEEIVRLATREFEGLASLLREHGVRVLVEEPLEGQRGCSDAVFPNNWVSFHEGKIVLYPMKVENRRRERRMDVVQRLCRELQAALVDYTSWEKEGKFLEGTGSMVLDRANRICYACLSQRTHPQVLAEFCRDFNYREVTFEASQVAPVDGTLCQVYHTNVICCLGETFALLCSESIRDAGERRKVVEAIEGTGKELVVIEEEQVFRFVGNCLQLRGSGGERLLVMSTAAYESFRSDQLAVLRKHVDHFLHVPLATIESLGGGGARCMLTEVFST